MTEPMTEALTAHDAARALARAQTWEAALLGRTQGLTWMIWALATPATFLTYSFVAALAEPQGVRVPDWVWNGLWVPWIAMGVVATVTLWRTAALATSQVDAKGDQRRATLGGLASSVVVFAIFLLLQPDSAVLPLGVIGAMWMLMAALNAWRADIHGRVVGLVVGGTLVAAAGAMTVARLDITTSSILSIVVSGLVPFLAGLWHLWRA